ncbi:MAG: ABC transporter permease [Anaerolineae bacterium]|nr:ABC transporter permease [Anaerolineae bacterium]
MLRYVQRRLLIAIPVVLGVATIAFALMHLLPGDPAEVMLAQSGGQAETLERLRHQLGLDLPLHVQYLRFLQNLLRGDFGESIWLRKPVSQILLQQLPATLELAVAAMLLAILGGVAMGLLAALKHNSWLDRLVMVISSVGISMPIFWSSLLGIYLFAAQLRWLPATGQGDLKHLILPAAVLGYGAAGSVARLMRSSMLEVLGQEYITAARAKGLFWRVVVMRHALKNALIPVVTMLGLQFGGLLGGAVITETVFSRQGLGRTMVDAIIWKDFPLVQGGVMLIAGMYVLVNLLVDISYGFIDPRIRHEA